MKVFLGGTVNGSKWRDYVMSKLEIDYFNPVVDEWTDEAYQRELYERKICDFCLYVLTPKMQGFYSIAEVTDDSYKKPDKTLFCYIAEDEGLTFDDEQLESLFRLGEIITANGSAWFKSLDEVISVLNSAKTLKETIKNKDRFNHVFISYGRRHSLNFARKLHDNLTEKGYQVWFDMNDIPLGVDFQEQIDRGIQKAENFIFIISPHSVKSIYCRKEIELAIKFNKRIIPLLHVFPTDCEDKMHPVIAKLNWIYFEEEKNKFEDSFTGLINLIESHKEYVRLHTQFLAKASDWEQHQYADSYLLVDKERHTAQEWLQIKDFYNKNGYVVQPPCIPTDLHCEFITESKEYAHGGMTDVFISSGAENKDFKMRIVRSLSQYCISSWIHEIDIMKGTDYENAIRDGIEKTDIILFFISSETVKSENCYLELKYAKEFHKRIIPLLIENVDRADFPHAIDGLQYIDFSKLKEKSDLKEITNENVKYEIEHRKTRSDYQKRIAELINEVLKDKSYYLQHKHLLVEARTWKKQGHNPSILLRGYHLEQAKTWLKLAREHIHKPTALQEEFINESDINSAYFSTEVYISHLIYDKDFAIKLVNNLRIAGKSVWFDHEYIPVDINREKEIENGIINSNNFIFIVSPDSIASQKIKQEFDIAKRQNKRIIAVQNKEININELPAFLADFQFIDFSNKDFQTSFNDLIRTLDFDREHIQGHTKLTQFAITWELANKNTDQLLRGIELQMAEHWLSEATLKNKIPEPSDLQIEYIKQSKYAVLVEENRKKRWARIVRILMIMMSFMFVASVIFAILAINQKQKAEHNEEKANKNAKIATEKQRVADSLALISKQNEYLAKVSQDEAIKAAKIAKQYANQVESKNIELILQQEKLHQQRDSIRLKNIALRSQQDSLQKGYLRLILQKVLIDSLFKKNVLSHLLSVSRNLSAKAVQYIYDEKIQMAVQYALYGHFLNRDKNGPYQNAENYEALQRCYNTLVQNEGTNIASFHQFPVRAISVNPANGMIATGDDGGVIHFWNINSVKKTVTSLYTSDRIRSLFFSKDGKYLAIGTISGILSICNLKTSGQLRQDIILRNNSPVKSVVVVNPDKDNYFVAYCTNNQLEIRKIEGNKLIPYLGLALSNSIESMTISNDGKFLLVGLTNSFVILQINYATKTFSFQKEITLESAQNISTIAISKNNSYIAAGDQKGHIWILKMIETNTLNYTISLIKATVEHLSQTTDLEFNSSSTQLATASLDRTVKLINLKNLDEERLILIGENKWIWAIMYSADDKKIITVGEDKKIRIWFTNSDDLAKELCPKNNKTFTQEEWERITETDNKNKLNPVPEICK